MPLNCFLNKFYQDNPAVNDIYRLIRSLKTTHWSLSDEMGRKDKKFKSTKEQASAFNHFFCAQIVNDKTQEVCAFSEATYNSLEFIINKKSQTLSKCSLGMGPDQVPGNGIRAVFNNLSVHLLKSVQQINSTSEYPHWKLIDIKPIHK